MTAVSWIAYAAGVLLDCLSTQSAIRSGRGREGNPLLVLAGDRWLLLRLALAVAVGIGSLWVGEYGAWLRLGAGVFYSGVALWNWRVAEGKN